MIFDITTFTLLVLYLNVFVLVDQLFRRIPALIVLAASGRAVPFGVPGR
jgi:hypothetical protein